MRKKGPPLIIFLYAVINCVGMAVFASGLQWFVNQQSLFIPDFPTTIVGATILLFSGLAVMVWSTAQVLRVKMMGKAEETSSEEENREA